MIDLQECRNEIDKIDSDIIRLFEQRMKVCEDVAEYKIRTGKKVLDPERERQKLEVLRVENSLLFFNALRKFEIPVEMHLYPVGGHGLSLANEETSNEDGGCVQKECQSWIELACKWMQNI